MKHFWHGIHGWFDFADLYRAQVNRVKDGAHFVEVGAFLGKSAAFMAVEIANSRKKIAFDACDTWTGVADDEAGDDGTDWQVGAIREHGSLIEACRKNLEPVGNLVRLRQGDSIQLAATYEDDSLDFVFLDDDHAGPHVYAELMAWWPKIKAGGVLAGHDFEKVGFKDLVEAVGLWARRTGVPVKSTSQRCFLIEKPAAADTWTRPFGQRSCLVAVACNERTIARSTAQSLFEIGWGQRAIDAMKAHGFERLDPTWEWRYVTVSDLRDRVALSALESDYSHILFLDADMVWPTDVLDKMLRHHAKGIVSGTYFLKKWPHQPVAMKKPVWNEQRQTYSYTYDEEGVESDAVRRVDLIGMGCALIPTEVFRRFPRPWFKYQTDAAGFSVISEDVWFCQQALAVGCPIWNDFSVVCGHDNHELVKTEHYLRGQMERRALAAVRQERGQSLELVEPSL